METLTYCNCCKSTNLEKVYEKPDTKYYPQEWFSVVKCRNCGLGFVNPRPTAQEIGRYYPASFFHYFREIDHIHRYAEEAHYVLNLTHGINRPKLLDIGCANGDFPRYMKRLGWNVSGLEIANASEAITDFPVYRVPLIEASIPENYFDVVTAWAVLEHVHDPMAHFKKIAEILKSGGHLVFLVTNFESIASRYLFAEDIPRHLYFYTPSTIKRYLEANKMKLIRIDFSNKIYSMPSSYWLIWLIYFLTGRELKYTNLPLTYRQWALKCNLDIKSFNKIKYTFSHPIACLDYILRPIIDWFFIKTNRYGIMIVTAKNCNRV